MIKRLTLLVSLSLMLPAGADDAAPPIAASTSTAASSDTSGYTRTITPSNDIGMGSDGTTKDDGSYQVRIGELYAPGGECYILPIRIPQMSEGYQVASAHLRTQLLSIAQESNGLGNADLYGLGVRDLSKALATDYYLGSKPDPKATLLQANFLTPKSPVRTDADTGPFVETSADGDAALAKYLNDAFSKPENAGKYVILRVSYDMDQIAAGNNAYMLLSSGAGNANELPVITYTIAPAKK